MQGAALSDKDVEDGGVQGGVSVGGD